MGRISIIIDGLFNMDRFFVKWMMFVYKIQIRNYLFY